MDYAAIKAEIAAEAYKGMTDVEVAAALNAKTIAVKAKVKTYTAKAILLKRGVWGALRLVADGRIAAPNELAAAAITAVDTMLYTETMDTDEPDTLAVTQQMLGAFVAAQIVPQVVMDELLALTDAKVSRADQLGLPMVAECDVQTARLV